MKTDAIRKIFLKFKKKKLDIKNWNVLEFFARDGSWHTNDYNKYVKNFNIFGIKLYICMTICLYTLIP